jgi:hypothetical protein
MSGVYNIRSTTRAVLLTSRPAGVVCLTAERVRISTTIVIASLIIINEHMTCKVRVGLTFYHKQTGPVVNSTRLYYGFFRELLQWSGIGNQSTVYGV